MGKRGLLVVVLVLMLGMLLAACSSENKEDKNSGSEGKNEEKITLNFWGAIPPENGPQAMVDAWNKDNPNVQVNYIRYVNDNDGKLKLDTALSTGTEIDMYTSYDLPALKKRASAGNAVALDSLGGYDIEKKIGTAAVKAFEIDGKVYGMPTTNTRRFLMLNKDLLDEHNLPIPYDWTWTELQEYAETLKTNDRYGFLQNLSNLKLGLNVPLEELGYTKSDGSSNFENDLVKQYLQTLKSMMDSKALLPYGEQIAMGSQYSDISLFLQGKSAMVSGETHFFRYSNNLKDYPRDFEIAFAPIPGIGKEATKGKYPGANGDMVSINPKSQHIEEAWKFLQWYTDGGLMPYVEAGRLPAAIEISPDETMKLLTKGAEDTYHLESLRKVLFDSSFDHFETKLDARQVDIQMAEVEKYFLGNQSLDDAVKEIAKRDTDFLKGNK